MMDKNQAIETCTLCGDETDRAGKYDDSLYSTWVKKPPMLNKDIGDEIGPLCKHCFDCLSICGFIED